MNLFYPNGIFLIHLYHLLFYMKKPLKYIKYVIIQNIFLRELYQHTAAHIYYCQTVSLKASVTFTDTKKRLKQSGLTGMWWVCCISLPTGHFKKTPIGPLNMNLAWGWIGVSYLRSINIHIHNFKHQFICLWWIKTTTNFAHLLPKART